MDFTAQDGSITQIDYAYDDAYRLTSESYLLAGGATSTTSYQYDRAGNRTQMSNSSGTTTYSYNKDDELVRVDLPDFYFEDYVYDAHGNLVETSYWREGVVPVQQGSPTLFEYSPRNLLTRVELPSTQRIDYNYQ